MFTINYHSREPIYSQLYNDVVRMIGMGVLLPNTKLPTVRSVAQELGVNPNTVAKSYQLLEQNGYICSAVGKGSFVSDNISIITEKKREAKENLTDALSAASDAGIMKDDVYGIVDEFYTGGRI